MIRDVSGLSGHLNVRNQLAIRGLALWNILSLEQCAIVDIKLILRYE